MTLHALRWVQKRIIGYCFKNIALNARNRLRGEKNASKRKMASQQAKMVSKQAKVVPKWFQSKPNWPQSNNIGLYSKNSLQFVGFVNKYLPPSVAQSKVSLKASFCFYFFFQRVILLFWMWYWIWDKQARNVKFINQNKLAIKTTSERCRI